MQQEEVLLSQGRGGGGSRRIALMVRLFTTFSAEGRQLSVDRHNAYVAGWGVCEDRIEIEIFQEVVELIGAERLKFKEVSSTETC